MEPAKIDWKRIESVFVEDKLYENINAPKWVDFLSPEEEADYVDDQSWFCRPDCNHPKSAEDFIKTTITSKISISVDKAKTPLGEMNQRDAKLKRRGHIQSSVGSGGQSQFNDDGENQNPNSVTPPNHQAKFMKPMIKSSAGKKKPMDDVSQTKEEPRLKSTLSASNLFAGKDILGHIAEFCNDLKKMATRAKEREIGEKMIKPESQMGERKVGVTVNEDSQNILREVNVKEKDRKPLLEMGRERDDGMDKGSMRENMKNKRVDETENIPVSLNMAYMKNQGEERLLQIQTNPPSPQCFSGTRTATKPAAPSKASKFRPIETGILQEAKRNKEMSEEIEDKGRSFSIVEGREARAMDIFWFLKPCTLSS